MTVLVKWLAIVSMLNCILLASAKSKWYDGENRPYDFGFDLDGNQHRKESKDAEGRIMGEFGFITADGTYHVTMFATDENGNYNILSKKSLRKIEEKLIKMITTPQVQEKLQYMVHSPIKTATGPFKSISTTDNHYNPQFPHNSASIGGGGANVGVAPTPFTITNPHQEDNSFSHHETSSQVDVNQQQVQPDPYYPTEQGRPPILEQPDHVANPTPFTIHQQPANNYDQQGYNNFQGAVSQTPVYNKQANEHTYNDEDVEQNNRKQEKKGRQLNLFGSVNPTDHNQSPPQSAIQSLLAFQGQSAPLPSQHQSQYPHAQQTPTYQQSQSPVYSELPAYQTQQPFADIYQQNTPIQSQQSQLSSPSSTGLLYKFNYTLPYHGHIEQGDAAGRKDGEYHVVNENGWKRVVTYTADENGFRPNSKYSYDASALPRDESLNHVEFKWFNVNESSN